MARRKVDALTPLDVLGEPGDIVLLAICVIALILIFAGIHGR